MIKIMQGFRTTTYHSKLVWHQPQYGFVLIVFLDDFYLNKKYDFSLFILWQNHTYISQNIPGWGYHRALYLQTRSHNDRKSKYVSIVYNTCNLIILIIFTVVMLNLISTILKIIFAFSIISQNVDGQGSLKPSPWNTKAFHCYIKIQSLLMSWWRKDTRHLHIEAEWRIYASVNLPHWFR